MTRAKGELSPNIFIESSDHAGVDYQRRQRKLDAHSRDKPDYVFERTTCSRTTRVRYTGISRR